MNVFQKCLRRQMGNVKYVRYAETCKNNFKKDGFSHITMVGNPIFNDMYEQLKEENKAKLTERKKDLAETVVVAFRITRYFIFVLLTYIMANIIILSLNLEYYVTCVSIILMGICFLYKLVEFVSNKYCVLDAYLFMLYRSVLEKILKEV